MARQRKKKGDPINGWIVLDKPLGMTSTQCVGYIKRIFNAQKAGHGGTLDPLATGLLPIALGEATKTMQFMLEADKTYRFTVTFGSETNTDDSEGEAVETSDKRPSKEQIEDALPQFTGKIEQIPPQFSAIKIDGQAAYKAARKGEEVEIKPREVTVFKLILTDITGSEDAVETATFTAKTSKGTYVRAIARDLGRLLGCYGHISQLRRTQVGVFTEEDAVSKEKLDKEHENEESLDPYLKDVAASLDDIPVYRASFKEEQLLKSGAQITRVHLTEGLRKVVVPDGRLVSLVDVQQTGKFKVLRNFNT